MNRIKIVGLCLMAMFAFSSVAAASASALRFVEEGPKEITKETATGTSGVSELASEIDKTKITIECKKDTFKGTVEAEGKSGATITYEECSLKGLSGCKVPKITAKLKDKLIENSSKAIEDEFEQESSSEPFATIVIETCTLKGSYKVTGTQTCELPESTVFKEKHEIVCTPSGSHLKLGSEPATYKGTATVELENKHKWAAEA